MWRRDLTELLEPELLQHPEKPFGYHDVPFGILCYPPEEEFAVRSEVNNLATRLENQGKTCTMVSIARLLFEVILAAAPLEKWEEAERTSGLDDVLKTLPGILQEDDGLVSLVLQEAESLAPDTGVLFLQHTGALFPFFRTSSLLARLEGKLTVPTILLYPGQRKGRYGLRFMGKGEAEHAYRAAIYGG